MSNDLTPIARQEWTPDKARHLLNRAGFGVPYSLDDKLHRLGPEAAVDWLVDYEKRTDPIPRPTGLPDAADAQEMRMMMSTKDKETRQEVRQEYAKEQRQAVQKLQAWWLTRMLKGSRPLEEKMCLFWHGHFATSAEKVKSAQANYDLNTVFRKHATDNFRALVTKVGQSPAMLRYLDNVQNRRKSPNENWARELMELFTIGIGNYTESDIKESARAFTGWTVRQGEFVFNRDMHDRGRKEFLGRRGYFDGDDIIGILLDQPETAAFISRKLWEYLVYETPSPTLVGALADEFRRENYELKPLLRTIFRSREFYSTRALGTQIKSPAQYLVELVDDLNLDAAMPVFDTSRPFWKLCRRTMRGLGQDLFFPPNVKGWEGNRAWVNSNTLLMRYNIPGFLITGERMDLRDGPRLDEAGTSRRRRRARERMRKHGPVDVQRLFKEYDRETIATAVDSLAQRFLSVPLAPEQRIALVGTLAPGRDEDDRFMSRDAKESDMRATLHLLMSMAEYQLC